jgi:hypothetical protein
VLIPGPCSVPNNKAALAVFLEVVRVLRENALPHGRIDILVSSAEETACTGRPLLTTPGSPPGLSAFRCKR